jgi:hypothetical protein
MGEIYLLSLHLFPFFEKERMRTCEHSDAITTKAPKQIKYRLNVCSYQMGQGGFNVLSFPNALIGNLIFNKQ